MAIFVHYHFLRVFNSEFFMIMNIIIFLIKINFLKKNCFQNFENIFFSKCINVQNFEQKKFEQKKNIFKIIKKKFQKRFRIGEKDVCEIFIKIGANKKSSIIR